MNYSKKIVVALLVTAVASLGIAGPSSAQPAKGQGITVQKLADNWCC